MYSLVFAAVYLAVLWSLAWGFYPFRVSTVAKLSYVFYFHPFVIEGFFFPYIGFLKIDEDESISYAADLGGDEYAYLISAIVGVALLLFDKGRPPGKELQWNREARIHWQRVSACAGLISTLVWAIAFHSIGGVGVALSTHKTEMLLLVNRWFSLAISISTIALIVSVMSKSYLGIALACMGCLADIAIGNRSGSAIALLSAFCAISLRGKVAPVDAPLPQMRDSKWSRKAARAGLSFILIFVFLFFGLMYKELISVARDGDWQMVAERTLSWEGITQTFLQAFYKSEPNIIQSVLVEVSRGKPIDYDSMDATKEVISAFIPAYGNQILPTRGFNGAFQVQLFGTDSFGMASNMWAWAWAISPIMVPIVAVVLYWGANRLYRLAIDSRQRPILFSCYIVTAILIAFYCHRNDVMYLVTLTKSYFFAGLLLYLCSVVIAALEKNRKSDAAAVVKK
jgi:hypothetical protein